MASPTERLFNTIVILGASLVAGCSSGSDDPGAKNKSSDNSNQGGASQFVVPRDAGSNDAGWTGW